MAIRPAQLTARLYALARLQNWTISANFPSQLKPGDSITGTITVTNPDTASHDVTVHVIPQWDTTKETTATKTIAAGQSATYNFPADFAPAANLPLLMPNKQAVLTITATIVVDTTPQTVAQTTVTINVPFYYQQICIGTFCIPVWMLLAGAAFLVIIGVAATRKKK
jgi:hypothetical protein